MLMILNDGQFDGATVYNHDTARGFRSTQQTGFPGGKPLNKYEDVVALLPWLLPAGLPISAVLLLAGFVGLFFLQRQQQAS